LAKDMQVLLFMQWSELDHACMGLTFMSATLTGVTKSGVTGWADPPLGGPSAQAAPDRESATS